MGLLDEAIREHLDLKRRRGDDPADLARLEREALGPAVRQPEPSQAADETPGEPAPETAPPAAESAVDEMPAAPEEAGQATAAFDPAQAFEDDHPAGAPPTEVAPAPPTPPEPAPAPPTPAERSVPAEPPAPAPPAPPPAAAEPAAPAAPPDTERAPESRPEPAEPPDEKPRAPAGEDGEEDEDVLEETPEFLQETPDHDRLWFEQKPPRDFDFDG
jgi:hypothetical protein